MALLVKNPIANAEDVRECAFDPWVEKIPWRKAWEHTPICLSGESPWTEEPGGLWSIGFKE